MHYQNSTWNFFDISFRLNYIFVKKFRPSIHSPLVIHLLLPIHMKPTSNPVINLWSLHYRAGRNDFFNATVHSSLNYCWFQNIPVSKERIQICSAVVSFVSFSSKIVKSAFVWFGNMFWFLNEATGAVSNLWWFALLSEIVIRKMRNCGM